MTTEIQNLKPSFSLAETFCGDYLPDDCHRRAMVAADEALAACPPEVTGKQDMDHMNEDRLDGLRMSPRQCSVTDIEDLIDQVDCLRAELALQQSEELRRFNQRWMRLPESIRSVACHVFEPLSDAIDRLCAENARLRAALEFVSPLAEEEWSGGLPYDTVGAKAICMMRAALGHGA
jgi:hypothetical protein